MAINRIVKQSKTKYFNRGMLSDGILLFTLSLISLGIEERTLVLFGREIYTVPDWSYTVFGTIAVILSILLLISAFLKRMAGITNSVIEGPFSFIYWLVFWIVYVLSWFKGLASIVQNEFTFYLLLFVGEIYFIIVTVVFIKSIIKYVKCLKEFSSSIGRK